jgi:hypothetical protein
MVNFYLLRNEKIIDNELRIMKIYCIFDQVKIVLLWIRKFLVWRS